MSKKGHFDGEKRAGRHTTLVEGTEHIVKKLNKMSEVSRVSPGKIVRKAGRKANKSVYAKVMSGGLEITVISAFSKQTIMVYTTCPERVAKKAQLQLRQRRQPPS